MIHKPRSDTIHNLLIIPLFFLLGLGTVFLLPRYVVFLQNRQGMVMSNQQQTSYDNQTAQTLVGIGGGPPATITSFPNGPACWR